MLEPIKQFIMSWLDPVGVVLGLLIAIPIIWTWYEVAIGQHRRQRRWFNEVRAQPGLRPGILVVDLLEGKKVRTAVENCRQQSAGMKAIPDNRVFYIQRSKRIKPEDMPSLAAEIRKTAAQVMSSGVDTLHYFHAGPTVAAALVGAEFSNSSRVMLYQYNGASGYENFGPLRVETA